MLIHYTTLWNVFTGRAVHRSAAFLHLQQLQHPCNNERPIHSRSWMLLEVWSNVIHHQSWSTPIYLKKEVQIIRQVVSDMTSLEDNPLDMLFQSSVW